MWNCLKVVLVIYFKGYTRSNRVMSEFNPTNSTITGMNYSNQFIGNISTSFPPEWSDILFYSVLLSISMLIGIIGNIVSICVLPSCTKNPYFLIGLAVADTIYVFV